MYYVIMTSQCARRTFKIYTLKKTGVLTIVILRRYNNCNIGAGDLKKAEKLITSKSLDHAELEALMDRLTRRAGEIAEMDAKIVMSLETEEDILKDMNQPYCFKIIYRTGNSKLSNFSKVNEKHR